jgi:hypothetical protein
MQTMLDDFDWRRIGVEERVTCRLIQANDLDAIPEIVRRQNVGLLLWVFRQPEDLRGICTSLLQVEQAPQRPARACFVAAELASHVPILMEAGAQIVVGQLPSLQQALPRLCAAAPLTSHGCHPLTSGLMARLPWNEQFQ